MKNPGAPAWAAAPSPTAVMLASGSSPSTAYTAARRRAFCSAPASRNAVIRSLGAQSMAPNSCARSRRSCGCLCSVEVWAHRERASRRCRLQATGRPSHGVNQMHGSRLVKPAHVYL